MVCAKRKDCPFLASFSLALAFPPRFLPAFKAFIRRCLTYDAAHRPDVAQLVEDPYLKKKLPTRDL